MVWVGSCVTTGMGEFVQRTGIALRYVDAA